MRTRTALPALGLVALLAVAPQATAADTKDKKKSQVVAVVGGDVYTITHEVIRNGTVLIKDGKIVAVGQDVEVPEGAKVIDAKGKYVTPGFVAVSMAGVGISGAGAGQGRGGRG